MKVKQNITTTLRRNEKYKSQSLAHDHAESADLKLKLLAQRVQLAQQHRQPNVSFETPSLPTKIVDTGTALLQSTQGDDSMLDAIGEHGVNQGMGVYHRTESALEVPYSASGQSQGTSSKRMSSKGISQSPTPQRSLMKKVSKRQSHTPIQVG